MPLLQQATPSGCEGSSLGYACSRRFDDVTLHWTTNASAPSNACTGVATAATAVDSSLGVLHMAVEAATTGVGYLVGWGTRTGPFTGRAAHGGGGSYHRCGLLGRMGH